MTSSRKIICLFGPTASGKTDLAIELVQEFPLDIISVDSAMVYRGMDIGTAKPDAEQLALAPHRLIDLYDPAESYSAGQFCLDAHREIEAIFAEGRVPLLVGGTLLYFHLLQKGFNHFPESSLEIREKVDKQAQKKGWAAMQHELEEIDPAMAKKIHRNDRQRIQRALEIFYTTGETMTALQQRQGWCSLPFEVINLVVALEDRQQVHQRIEQRFDQMLKYGLLAEAEGLYQRDDWSESLPAMRMVGYRQLWPYFAGDYDFSTMRERAIVATRQFAKRQYTWLNQWPDGKRFNNPKFDKIKSHVQSLLGH